MKSLIIVRHAKSSWDNTVQSDFERPLNDRGNKDAPCMAKRLKARNIKIDSFVSSPANRAKQTALYFAEAFDLKPHDIVFIPELYHAPMHVFYKVIGAINDTIDTAIIFSHNPGITEFVNSLTEVRIDNMPTSGTFAIKSIIKNWTDFEKGEKAFWFFDYPKLK